VYSLCGVVIIVIVACPSGKDFFSLSYLSTVLIFSRTCINPSKPFCIYPLWCLASSKASAVWSCNFSTTSSVSFFVIVYSESCLCDFAFLHDPPFCNIDVIGGHDSYGVDVEGVPCISVALAPCSFCCGAMSLCIASVFLFDALPFVYYTSFGWVSLALSTF